ncbi:MAG TPA: FtsX-like permease family protein [Bacillota bacterium]|nr:FtsX-like permease family protein [Bacillota bacterium]HQI15366.1 FtsX-like permease family protein [Bacillota bacterium]HQJ37334.1 FtsX-like permease family protein [Bacillota bacterium]HQL35097.1 FtsX-like permease family protein [Bacillota bacterium]
MKKLDVRLLRMVNHSKGQFVSVTVIVAVALCIYILFSITTININNAVEQYYGETNINDIVIELMRVPQAAVDDLKSIDGISNVQGRVSVDVPLQVDDKNERVNIRIVSIPKNGGVINKLHTIKGNRSELGDDNVILLQQFANARNIEIDEVITPYINGRTHNLRVSGIAASSEYIYLMENEQSLLPALDKFGVAYVTEAFAQSVFGYRGSYNEVLIKLAEQKNIEDVIDIVEKKLDKYGLKRITKLEDQLSNNVLMQKIEGIEMMSSVLPVMFLMVAAIIISIMLSRIVNNDRMAIGVLKALGYSNYNILSHYTKYALAIGLAGSAAGITGGVLLSKPMSEVFVSYFNIPLSGIKVQYSYILNAIVLTSLFCIGSGLFGARGVIKIMPADSMRPEAPKSGKRIILERLTILWRRVSFSWKMVVRNIFRNKKRFSFLVLGLALAYGINVVPLYMMNTMVSMFELQYGEYQKMDYTINFARPLSEGKITDLSHLIKADRIEPRIEYPFELANGWRKNTVAIIGIPQETAFYKFVDKESNDVKLPDKGIFITEAIAKSLNVREGESIIVKSFLPGKKDVPLKVAGIVKQYLGANAYMNIEEMRTLLLERQMITGVSVASKDNLKEKLKDVKNITTISSVDDMKQSFVEYLDTMNLAIWMYMLFGGILGFALIYNATIISISERKMEFASLRIMGFEKKDIYSMLSKENLIMALIAIIVGVPLGAGMINGMADSFSSEMITFPVIFSPRFFIQAAAATIIFAIIAQLAALRRIYNLNFIDALKSRIS